MSEIISQRGFAAYLLSTGWRRSAAPQDGMTWFQRLHGHTAVHDGEAVRADAIDAIADVENRPAHEVSASLALCEAAIAAQEEVAALVVKADRANRYGWPLRATEIREAARALQGLRDRLLHQAGVDLAMWLNLMGCDAAQETSPGDSARRGVQLSSTTPAPVSTPPASERVSEGGDPTGTASAPASLGTPPAASASAPAVGEFSGGAPTRGWIVFILRDGGQLPTTFCSFDSEAEARVFFDTASANWSDSFLCRIVRGPRDGEPVLEPEDHHRDGKALDIGPKRAGDRHRHGP